MRKIIALLITAVMLLSMTACDLSTILELAMDAAENAETGDSGDETQQGDDEGDKASEAKSWDELELPEGFPRLADSVDTFRFDESTEMYNFIWKGTDYATSEAMINTLKEWANGKITGSVVGKTTNWRIQNDRINLTAAFDEEGKTFVIATQVFEGTTLSAYLSAHSLTEDDFKPANFTEFGEIVTSGEKVGGITQNGAFEIHIKDGTYKKEDAAAWCDAIIKRLVEISAASDGTVADLRNKPITSYSEYAANDGGIPEHPAIGCYFVSKLNAKKYMVKIIAGYYAEENEYRVELSTMSFLP